MARRILTARDQVEMLSPWRRAAVIKEARYPQEWPGGKAPYGYIPGSGRARNRPPTVLRDPDNPDAGVIDPSEIRYEERADNSVSAYHPNGDHLGNYSWEGGEYGEPAKIGIAQVNPRYQGQGVGGAIIDYIRENKHPDLVHSGYQGKGSLSYQGRAAALRDLGNTEEEHNDYFNTTPYNYGEPEPATFSFGRATEAQRKAHKELMRQFDEDRQHPNYNGIRSRNTYDDDMRDEYGDQHEYGYDANGDYVGLSSGGKDSRGYSADGYDYQGYDEEGYDRGGLDREGYDQEGFHDVTGLNRDGETRHGYTPGDGTPPGGTVPMSQMSSHWDENGLPPKNPQHEQMMDDALNYEISPTMYAVRQPNQRSPHTGDYHVGNGDTLYSSLERAREVAYHPDDPGKDKDIVSVDHLDPDHLHTDASGDTPEDFHYAPVSGWNDGEDTASTSADLVHDPHRHERILGDLGPGWSRGYLQTAAGTSSDHPTLEYTDPHSGRTGYMYQRNNGGWRTQHQPEFGRPQGFTHDSYRDAADTIREGTKPGPTMDQHALEVNNDYHATGGGEFTDWAPHPNGQGLTTRTPHGDLHVMQDPTDGSWNWHAGPHGSQPGDNGNMTGSLSTSLTGAAEAGISAITNRPFHGGLRDELGEGWSPHPTSAAAFTRPLPSGNHAFMRKNADGTYNVGIQRSNSGGQPYASPIALRDTPDLAQAHAFIQHRENPVPASDLGEGWEDLDRGPRAFPTYLHENHPSGATAHVAWDEPTGTWRSSVHHTYETFDSKHHKTPQDAAAWARSTMDDLRAGTKMKV